MAARSSLPRSAAARRRRPIQLASLRGFDVAAKKLSFTLAAEELALTQSSISRQIGALEREVGKALFVRKTRALELTPVGARLRPASVVDGAEQTRRTNGASRYGACFATFGVRSTLDTS